MWDGWKLWEATNPGDASLDDLAVTSWTTFRAACRIRTTLQWAPVSVRLPWLTLAVVLAAGLVGPVPGLVQGGGVLPRVVASNISLVDVHVVFRSSGTLFSMKIAVSRKKRLFGKLILSLFTFQVVLAYF